MTDPVERLRALARPYGACAVPPHADLALRARRRVVRAGTLTGSALAGVVALAVTMTGTGGTQSLRVTTDPVPSATARPSATPAAPPGTASPAPAEPTGPAATGQPVGQPTAPPGEPSPTATEPPPAPAEPPPSAAPTTAPAAALTPRYWQGAYGTAPYFARQLVADAGYNFCEWEPTEADRVLGSGGRTCQRFVVQPGSEHGGDYLGELVLCRAPQSYNAAGFPANDPELEYDVEDFDGKQSVRHWQDPPSYTSSGFTLQPGDCAVYVLHQPLRRTDGTAFTAGHRHHLTYRHMGGSELVSETFVAP